MKRRSFFEKITMAVTGAILLGKEWLFGASNAPAPTAPNRDSRRDDELKLLFAELEYPVAAWEPLLAVSQLGEEVLANPVTAKRFSNNPRAYFSSIGLPNVTLSPDDYEVKIAMAFADESIREALESNDMRAYIQSLKRLGLLNMPNSPSQIADVLKAHLRNLGFDVDAEGAPSPAACTAVMACVLAVFYLKYTLTFNILWTFNFFLVRNVLLFFDYTFAYKYTGVEPIGMNHLPPFQIATILGKKPVTDEMWAAFIEDAVAMSKEAMAIMKEELSLTFDEAKAEEILRFALGKQVLSNLEGVLPLKHDGV